MKKIFAKMDKPLLILMFVYTIFGLIMIFSASNVSAVLRYGVSPNYYFLRQAIFVVIAYVVCMIFVLRMPTKKYGLFTPILVLGIIAALVGLFIYGVVRGGAKGWYNFGFFNLQPVEFAKSIMIIFMATFYNKLLKKKNASPIEYLIPIIFGIIMCVLVAAQPDLGGAIILAGLVFMVFISLPLPKNLKKNIFRILGVGVGLLVVVFLFKGDSIIKSYQTSRFNFINPCSRYTETSGYQVCNGFIAVHNGGLFGVGLGNSTQKYMYLPEAHTDFIFPIIVEELGLIIGVVVLLGYIYMLYRILRIAKDAENLRCSILAYGAFIYLLLHILVNLFGVFALIPLTGVPLPFLSYGGSYGLNVVIMMFIVQRVNIENKINKNNREIANM